MKELERKELGRAEKVSDAFTPDEENVSFLLPYGEESFEVVLEDEELDFLLGRGLTRILSNQALGDFDATIPLPRPDLPLFTGARSIEMKPKESRFHDVKMGVSVVTMSHSNEHRGILCVERPAAIGEWSKVSYEIQPPLKDPELIVD